MNNYSLTYIGTIVLFLSFIVKLLNLNIGNAELTTTVETIAAIIGALLAFIGRYRLGGITRLGMRVKKNE